MPATLNLLPRKEFEITLKDGSIIKGQFGTWALKRFCDKLKYSIKQAGDHLGDPAMADVVEYILCAVEHTARKTKQPFEFTDVDACDWIDQLGGWQGETFVKLFNHSAGEDTGEKKTEPVI
jgi:hypothetical protein